MGLGALGRGQAAFGMGGVLLLHSLDRDRKLGDRGGGHGRMTREEKNEWGKRGAAQRNQRDQRGKDTDQSPKRGFQDGHQLETVLPSFWQSRVAKACVKAIGLIDKDLHYYN